MVYRKHKYGYAYRRIYLGEGEWTILDQEDYYRLGRYNWSATCSDGHIYAARIVRNTSFGRITTIYMHREVMNPPKGLLVDHRKGNTLDNRIDNLRTATRSENVYNRQKTKSKTSSRFIGVHLQKRRNKWIAQISYRRIRIYLGTFVNEIDAARVYDEAAKKYHGEFAQLNFPKEIERSPRRLNLRSAVKSLWGASQIGQGPG
jgi:hypothetical protein